VQAGKLALRSMSYTVEANLKMFSLWSEQLVKALMTKLNEYLKKEGEKRKSKKERKERSD
jgi:hypothetical protein